MQRKTLLIVVVSLAVVLATVLAAAAQGPQPAQRFAAAAQLGTGFTYQGQLKSGGIPVNGSCNIAFRLYDAASGGNVLGSVFTPTVPITDGLFTTVLDFGLGALNGDARWLDMQVHCPAGPGVFSALTPRQALTPALLALALPGLWTEQNATSPNLIGGFSGNVISTGVSGAAIGGGGAAGAINRILLGADNAVIDGGSNNTASGNGSTVGGGVSNSTAGNFTTVGGGNNNNATVLYSTVSGGSSNNATAQRSTVAGGISNLADGDTSTVTGGGGNHASGGYAVAGGFQNTAGNDGAVAAGGGNNKANGVNSVVSGGDLDFLTLGILGHNYWESLIDVCRAPGHDRRSIGTRSQVYA